MSEITITDELGCRYFEAKLAELREQVNGLPSPSYYDFNPITGLVLKEDEGRKLIEQKMADILTALKNYYAKR